MYPETTTPYDFWTKQKLLFNKLHIFGATVYVHNYMNKKLDHKATAGLFLGYGASTAVVYYYDKIKHQVKCAHHVPVNDLQIGGSDETLGSKLISKHATLHNIILPESISTLEKIKTPFEYDQIFSYEVQLPQQGSLGLNMENDPVFGLPIINHMSENSPFKMG